MASQIVAQVTDLDFDKEVIGSEIPVLVDFWAEWCMPCRMLAPIIDELAGEYAGRAKFVKLNVDNSRQTAVKFGISAIPTLLIFKNGQLARKLVGLKSKKDLKADLDAVLS